MATDSTYEQRIIDVDPIDKSSGDAIICGLQAGSVLLRREEVAIPTVTRHQLLILYTARPISYETHDQILNSACTASNQEKTIQKVCHN